MHEERNLAIAERWFRELWSVPDPDVADEIVAGNYAPEWIQIDATGPAQVKHEIRYFRSIFPDLTYEIVDAVANGDKVWVRYRGTGTQQGSAWGFESKGGAVTFEGVTIFQLDDQGKIIDRWGAFSFYDILVDLDLVPPLWELSKILGDR
jgi:predicted ester cyclase